MHETSVHKLKHIAHAFLPGTNCPRCMCEYHTKDKAIRHFKTTKMCLFRMRYVKLEGLGYSAETPEGIEFAMLKTEPRIRLPGPLRWETDPPLETQFPHHHQAM